MMNIKKFSDKCFKEISSLCPNGYDYFKELKKVQNTIKQFTNNQEYNDEHHPSEMYSLLELSQWYPIRKRIDDFFFFISYGKPQWRIRSPLHPFPLDNSFPIKYQFIQSLKYLNELNKQKPSNENIIYYVPSFIQKNIHFKTNKFKIRKMDNTCIYNADNLLKLEGKEYKEIRYNINFFKRNFKNIEVEDFDINKHFLSIMNLEQLNSKNIGSRLAVTNLFNYNLLKKLDNTIDGFVIKVDDEVVSLNVASKIDKTIIGCISRSNHKFRGVTELSYFLEAERMKEKYPEIKYANCGGYLIEHASKKNQEISLNLFRFKKKFNLLQNSGEEYSIIFKSKI